MTNSPQEPQNPIPERRQRPAAGVTFDEMIAIVVAFSAIGAILFWSLGGRKSGIVGNLGLGENSNLFSSNKTTATGFSFGKLGIGRTDSNAVKSDDRELVSQLRQSESPVVFVPPASQEPNLPNKVKENAYRLDSGAKLVPLAGVAALPALNAPASEKPQAVVRKPSAPKVKERSAPKVVKEPSAPAPKQSAMPRDVTPKEWAYPFLEQMNKQGLLSDLTTDKNFEPNKLITRASMATLISRGFDMQPETQGIKKFQDVTNNNELAADIDKAVRLGFMKGYSENTFRPLENIPRYQVLVTLATGLDLKPSQDADKILQNLKGSEDIPNWAKEQVAAAYESNLIVNRPAFANDSLMSEQPATRGEVAAMIHQALVKTGKLQPLESKQIVKP